MEITDDQIDDILYSLNQYAEELDCYELGLPIYGSRLSDMRAIVRSVLSNQQQKTF